MWGGGYFPQCWSRFYHVAFCLFYTYTYASTHSCLIKIPGWLERPTTKAISSFGGINSKVRRRSLIEWHCRQGKYLINRIVLKPIKHFNDRAAKLKEIPRHLKSTLISLLPYTGFTVRMFWTDKKKNMLAQKVVKVGCSKICDKNKQVFMSIRWMEKNSSSSVM